MSKSHLPWCRVHETWYTTRSHAELGAVALNIGPRLMSLANASPERGVLLGASGRPLTLEVLARETRFDAAAVASALAELVACGTLTARPDGAHAFANFLRWQEDPSAERQRRARERSRDSHARGHAVVTPPVTGKSRTEDRGQRIEEEGSPSEIQVGLSAATEPPPEAPPATDKPAAPDASAEDVRAVFAHYRRHHPRSFAKPSPSSPEWRAIAKRLSEGSTVEDLCDAIDGCHLTPHNLGKNDRGTKYLGLELIMRSGSQVTRFAETARSGHGTGERKLTATEAKLDAIAEAHAAYDAIRARTSAPSSARAPPRGRAEPLQTQAFTEVRDG